MSTMKNLVIRPADVSLNPLGAGSSVADATVSVVYDRDVWANGQPVPRVPLVSTSIPAGGLRVPVLASDDPSITEGAGFVIKVVVETAPRIGQHNETGVSLARTIQVVTADPDEIPLGSKSSLTQVADPAQYADVMSAIAAAAAAKSDAAQSSASAAAAKSDAAAAKSDAAAALDKATKAVTSQDTATAQNIATGAQTQAALRAADFLVKRDADAVIRSLALTSSLGNTVMMRLAKGLNGARWSMESSTKATGTAGMELQLLPDDNVNPNGSGTEILLFHKTGPNYQRTVWHTQAQTSYLGCSSGGTAPIMPMVFYMGEYAPQGVPGVNAMVLSGDGTVTINGGRAIVNTGLIPTGATVSSVAADGKSAVISAAPASGGEWAPGGGYTTQILIGSTTLTGVTITADSTTITSPASVFTSAMVGQSIVDQRVYSSGYARIGDVMDSGQSRLIIDTCTKTPSKAATSDKAVIQHSRGGVSKWRTGNNVAGANADSYDITNAQNVSFVRIHQNGNIGLGLNANQNSLTPSGVGAIGVSNVTSAPTSNPTGGGNLYASNGALYWRGSNGTVTKIAEA